MALKRVELYNVIRITYCMTYCIFTCNAPTMRIVLQVVFINKKVGVLHATPMVISWYISKILLFPCYCYFHNFTVNFYGLTMHKTHIRCK